MSEPDPINPAGSSDLGIEPDLFRGATLVQKLHRSEAVLGFIFAYFVFLLLFAGGPFVILWWAIYAKPPISPYLAIGLGVIWLALVYLEYRLLQDFGKALSDGIDPISERAAFGMARRGVFWPLLTVWLAGHVVLVPALAEGFTTVFHGGRYNLVEKIFSYSVATVVGLMAAHAAHTFLLATVATATGSESLVHRIWRWRFPIDLLQLYLMWVLAS